MTLYRKNTDWHEAKVKDEMLMMHAETGKFVQLNESGAFLWSCLAEPQGIDLLADRLSTVFEASVPQARADVDMWIEQMCKHGVIEADAN